MSPATVAVTLELSGRQGEVKVLPEAGPEELGGRDEHSALRTAAAGPPAWKEFSPFKAGPIHGAILAPHQAVTQTAALSLLPPTFLGIPHLPLPMPEPLFCPILQDM